MGFAASRTGEEIVGNRRITWGTFTNDGGSTGGDIDTGLHYVDRMTLTAGAAIHADSPAINETLPCLGSAVTIVTSANGCGFWEAKGDC